MDNSDRYYRLTTMSVGSRPDEAEHAALAFRCVAQVWLGVGGLHILRSYGVVHIMDCQTIGPLPSVLCHCVLPSRRLPLRLPHTQVYLDTRGDAALLAGAFTFLEVLFLGGLWYLAGMNVAAPAAAAMAIASVDYWHLHQAVEAGSGQTQ